MKKTGSPPKTKFAPSKAPKIGTAPKANVLGPLGRNQQPVSMTRPGSVVSEFAREQDVENDNSEAGYTTPKLKKK